MSFATLQNHRPDFFIEARHLPDIVKLRYRRVIALIICFFIEPTTEVTIEFEDPRLCDECLKALKQELLDLFKEGDEPFAEFQPAGMPFLRLHVYDEDRLVFGQELEDMADLVASFLATCQSGHHIRATTA